VRSCESLLSIRLSNTVIDSATVDTGDDRVPASCRITATVTHPPAGDEVKVFIALPLKNWNGRFQGTGGEGFSGGDRNYVRRPLGSRYAAAATDAGHQTSGGSFALDSTGRLNWHAIRDYAQVGIHEMTTTGKALTEAFYGRPPARSYFEGCSTGGRQALMEAQRFANDYDGIVAGAPNINLPQLLVAHLWVAVLMQETKNLLQPCKLRAATAAALAACDAIDGVKDNVIDDPRLCTFDPSRLIGIPAGECGAMTSADAGMIARIWEGPRRRDGSFMWYGPERGAVLDEMVDGATLAPRPNRMALEWWRFFLIQDPRWELSGLTRASFEHYWDRSVEEFGAVIGTNDPNLSAFRDRGGKMILWHGWNDTSIPPQGTIQYYTRVQQQMDGADNTNEFARLFLAPGVAHCGGGAGPHPEGRLDAVVQWVEEGKAPDALNGLRWGVGDQDNDKVVGSRPVCRYPLMGRYTGRGSTDDAANFECRVP
jgi:feruloyl esterase